MDYKIEFKLSFFSWSYFLIISGFSSKHSNTYSSFYYQEYRLLQGTSLVAEEWGLKGGGWEVLNNIFNNGFIFFNVLIVRFFFENYTDCTFFSKIARIVRFFLQMYGFLYGFFQNSFGQPEFPQK